MAQGEGIVALTQTGGLPITAGLRVVMLVVLGFLLLEILYLVSCALFGWHDRNNGQRSSAAVRDG